MALFSGTQLSKLRNLNNSFESSILLGFFSYEIFVCDLKSVMVYGD